MPCPRKSKPPSSLARCSKTSMNVRADDLALLLRVGHAGQPVEEQVGGVDEVERQLQLLAEALLDLVGLVVAQQPVVDEDAGQPIADRAVDQHRRDRRVDAARQPADHLARRRPAPDALGRLFDERGNRPVAACSRRRRRRSCAGSRRRGRCARPRDGTAARRATRSGASIAAIGAVALVAATANPGGTAATSSPWLAQTRSSSGTSAKEPRRGAAVAGDAHERVAELAMARPAHFAAEHVGHQLHAVADAEHRRCRGRRAAASHFGAPVLGHALRPARQDDAGRLSSREASRAAC